MSVNLVVYARRLSDGKNLCASASQARGAYASDVLAQLYKLSCWCMHGFACVAQGYLIFFLFGYSKLWDTETESQMGCIEAQNEHLEDV